MLPELVYVNTLFVVIAKEYLGEREATIRRQKTITELSTPVVPVQPGLLVVPIVGVVDKPRAEQLRAQLLAGIDLGVVACAADLRAGIQRANAMLPTTVVPRRCRA